MPRFYEWAHVAVKEGQQERLDMGTVRIRIGHDDNLVIVGIFEGEVRTNTRTNGVNHGVDFFIFENVCHFSFSGIDDLTAQGQNCLKLPVASLLGRATR